MRFSLAAIAFAAYAVAQSTSVFFTNVPSTFQAGQASTVTFTSTGPVDIILRKGDSNNLATIGTVGSNVSGGSFSFTPSSSLASGSDYALQITQGSEINYSQQFTINGAASSTAAYGGASATSGPSSASASGSASASASASASGSASSSLPVVATPAPSAGIYPMGNSTGPAYGTGAAPYPIPQGTGSPRPASNSTMLSMTPSATSSYNMPTGGSGTSGSSASGSARPSNGAGQVGSSLALIIGAIAAFAYIN